MKLFPAILILSLCLSACVEIKDPEISPENPEVVPQVKSLRTLVVDQPLVLWQEEILTMEEAQKRDLSVSTGRPWKYDFDFVEIMPEGVLYTFGENVDLSIGKLISNGRLVTFPAGSTAPRGRSGRSGGYIGLKVANIEGHLGIEMRGENGGPGENGIDLGVNNCINSNPKSISGPYVYAPLVQGQNGGDGGGTGTLIISQPTDQGMPFTVIKQEGLGGLGGQPFPRAHLRCEFNPYFKAELKTGEKGAIGKREPHCYQRAGSIACTP